MPITLTQTPGQFPNRYPNMNAALVIAAHKAIGKLEYADIFRGAKSKVREDDGRTMRIDVQGDVAATANTPLKKNIQVQVNGVGSPSTAAAVLVSTSTATADPANQRGVLRKVRIALCMSLSTMSEVTVTGAIA